MILSLSLALIFFFCKSNKSILLSSQRKTCTLAKFIASLMVVNGHIFVFSDLHNFWSREFALGGVFVGLFIFISGYGLMNNYKQNGRQYLNHFLRLRLVKILIPLIVAYFITLPVYNLCKGTIIWSNVVKTILWGGPYLQFSWYVTEIIAIYVIFYLVMRFNLDTKFKLALLTVITIVIMMTLFISHQPGWYITPLPAFIIGIWYNIYENSIIKLFNRCLNLLLVSFLILFVFSYEWTYVGHGLSCFFSNYLYVIFAVITFAMIISSVKPFYIHGIVKQNIIKSFYEIYLMQNCIMILFEPIKHNFMLYWFLVMIFTILVGTLTHYVNEYILRQIKKKKYES